ncbi:unnamed protein product [Rodentolepis nana]|uniref:Lectin_legB domain-containing protein n=1 Tax=Rodentolepis nana TaxID=102285 RepID=A0A0R3T433_RODNA|nr:unnamed protein product [Rodentolepis nana]
MIMRGSLNSHVDINASLFFAKHNNDSITTTEITESHGFLIFNICEYEDTKGTATFDNHEKAICRNSGSNLMWHFLKRDSKWSPDLVVLTFQSRRWDPPNNAEHNGVKFQFTISNEDIDEVLHVPAIRGVRIRMEFTEQLMKPKSRLGVGMLIFTNSSIQNNQKFLQTGTFNFGMELEPGNFLSTSIQLDKRDPPEPKPPNASPAYLFWRDVCFVDAEDRWHSGRRVVAFQSVLPHTHKENQHVNRSLPQIIYGAKRFNIHLRNNDTVAVMEEWFGFGSPLDGFYAKTNYTDWTFVMALGHLPPDNSPHAGRLFAPLIMPLLVLVVTLAYYFGRRRFCPLPTADLPDMTQPLIDEIIDDGGNGYPGFGDPCVEEACENATEIPSPAPNSYGAI